MYISNEKFYSALICLVLCFWQIKERKKKTLRRFSISQTNKNPIIKLLICAFCSVQSICCQFFFTSIFYFLVFYVCSVFCLLEVLNLTRSYFWNRPTCGEKFKNSTALNSITCLFHFFSYFFFFFFTQIDFWPFFCSKCANKQYNKVKVLDNYYKR